MLLTSDFLTTMSADKSEIGHARAAFSQWLRSGAVDRETLDDLLVVASELLANAIHASPGASTVALRATNNRNVITIEAVNRVAEWVTPADRWNLDDPLRTGGRGLLIVSALVDHIEAEHDLTDLCTVVRVSRNLASTQHHDRPHAAEIADLEPGLRI